MRQPQYSVPSTARRFAAGGLVAGGFFADDGTFPRRRQRLDYDTDAGMQSSGDTSEHAERVAFVSGRFEAADLLLGSVETLGKFLLGNTGFFAQTGDLKRDVPGFAGGLEALGEIWVAELFFEKKIKVGFAHATPI